MRYKVLFCHILLLTFIFLPNTLAQAKPAVVPLPIGIWTWPLDEPFVVLNSSKYGTTLENTDFDVKNLDLVHPSTEHLTCFNVGWHRLYHAGVDLYRAGGGTANTEVKAVSDGEVVYAGGFYPGIAVIIYHQIGTVYSVYMHLQEDTALVSEGDIVVAGQPIGYVRSSEYYGRFPDSHPFGEDDAHLHFEIRDFEDGSYLFPNYPDCDLRGTAFGDLKAGVGYTYPEGPYAYGYRDPIQFIEDRMIPPSMPYQLFLPMILSDESCIEGQNLIQYNPGFEFPVDDPEPWFQIITYFEPPNIFYYHLVQDDPYRAYTGNHFAFFGNQVPAGGWIVDEEMVQSFRIPGGTQWIEWINYLWLEQTGGGPGNYGTEFGDKHIFTLQDAVTGRNITTDVTIDHTSTGYPNYVWLQQRLTFDASSLGNRAVRPSYSSITDGDTTASTIRLDEIRFITHCSGTPNLNGLTPQIEVTEVNKN